MTYDNKPLNIFKVIIVAGSFVVYTIIASIIVLFLSFRLIGDVEKVNINRYMLIELVAISTIAGGLIRAGWARICSKLKIKKSGEMCVHVWIVITAIVSALLPNRNIQQLFAIFVFQFMLVGMNWVPIRFTALYSIQPHLKKRNADPLNIHLLVISVVTFIYLIELLGWRIDSMRLVRLAFAVFLVGNVLQQIVRQKEASDMDC